MQEQKEGVPFRIENLGMWILGRSVFFQAGRCSLGAVSEAVSCFEGG